jgi:TonB family protein
MIQSHIRVSVLVVALMGALAQCAAPPPPPLDNVSAGRLDNPSFTPMTARPRLRNADEVQRVLIREYPGHLRDAGIGGSPVVWAYIGTDGRVENTRIYQSSGLRSLDAAAANVVRAMRFTPAQNGDEAIPVWVQIPIRFSVVN